MHILQRDGHKTALEQVGSQRFSALAPQAAVNPLSRAATIVALFAFGLVYGFLGMMLATPMAAVLLMLVRRLYVEEYLEHEPASEVPVGQPVLIRRP